MAISQPGDPELVAVSVDASSTAAAAAPAASGRRGRFADRRSRNFDYQPLSDLESQVTVSPRAPPRRSPTRRARTLTARTGAATAEPEEPLVEAVSIRGNFSGREGFAHSTIERRLLAAAPSLATQERSEFAHQLDRYDPEVILRGCTQLAQEPPGARCRGARGWCRSPRRRADGWVHRCPLD